MSKALGALKIAQTGYGSEGVQQIRSFLTTMGATLPSDMATNFDLAKKYMMDTVVGKSGGMSNDMLETIKGANANTQTTNPAAQDVLKTNIGRERLALSATKEAPDPLGKDFLQHKVQYSQKYDPHAFALDLYTKPEIEAYRSHLKTPLERERFNAGVIEAKRLGFLP